MAEQAVDRRTRRTRKLLKQGLLELLHEKRFADITAREITDRMDMNRGTFYLHFSDTAALMQSIEEDMLAEVQALLDASREQAAESHSLRAVFETLLDYTVEHHDLCAALFENASGSAILGKLQDLVQRNGLLLLQRQHDIRGGADTPYLLAFLACGLVGLVKEWFDRGMALPRETLVRTADAMMEGAVRALIEA